MSLLSLCRRIQAAVFLMKINDFIKKQDWKNLDNLIKVLYTQMVRQMLPGFFSSERKCNQGSKGRLEKVWKE